MKRFATGEVTEGLTEGKTTAVHSGTVNALCELAHRGYRTEGYIMRDEYGNCTLIHAGRIAHITNAELDEILDPTSATQFSDEEES